MEKVTLGSERVLIKKGAETYARYFLQTINSFTGGMSVVEGEDFVQHEIPRVRFKTGSHTYWEPKKELLELYFV